MGREIFSKTIFLADDDQDDCVFFSEALREVCFDATLLTAKNGQLLLDELAKPPEPLPDLIFLDLNMPIMDGYDCLKEIRNDILLKNRPVIIFTTSSSESDLDKVYALGANRFVTKPSTFKDLKLVIQKILEINWMGHCGQPNRKDFKLFA